MKIRSVTYDNRTKAFKVTTHGKLHSFPYAKLPARRSRTSLVTNVYVDDELGNEAFTYELDSGEEGTVDLDQGPRVQPRSPLPAICCSTSSPWSRSSG